MDGDDIFADKHEEPAHAAPQGYGYSRPHAPAVHAQSAMERPSVDAYGAFDGDMPGAPRSDAGASRTMQLAYDDPCGWYSGPLTTDAQVRASVMSDVGYAPQPVPTPQPYQQQAYGGRPASGYGYQ